MTDQPTPCRSTQHCAEHGFCHRCTPSLDGAVRHLVKAISAAGITTGSGHVYAQLAATVRDAARQTGQQPDETVAYGDGKGRVYCRNCASTTAADLPLVIDHVDHWETCGSCGRYVVDVARQQPTPAAGLDASQPATEAHPADVTFTVEKRGDTDWLTASTHYSDREKAASRLAQRREQYPDTEFRIVRETTTWTVEETDQ